MNKLLVALLLFTTPALAEVDIDISKKTQTMTVTIDGEQIGYWPVSTARKGYYTPTGTWHPYSLQLMHYSKKYDNAPMPNSIFFSGGYAIHATPHVGNLGRPASHGCVRLSPHNASYLYNIVKNHTGETTITIR
jgi:lipoprotein-anchoring transpeptidase ErfK/SrfK